MRRPAIVLLLLFAACGRSSPPDDTVAAVSRRVAAWRPDARCPADVMPARQDVTFLDKRECWTTPTERCLDRCESGDGASCYWLGQGVLERSDATAEALFQRACSLGVASGCTNRAAGMLKAAGTSDHRLDQCAAATFAKACAVDDPWACTMYASHLVRGAGVNKDPQLALRVLEKSCKYGRDDPACENAMQIREEILKKTKAAAGP